jgi:hypothetical protein
MTPPTPQQVEEARRLLARGGWCPTAENTILCAEKAELEAKYTALRERRGIAELPPAAREEVTSLLSDPYTELNKDYAFVLAGGDAHILWETTDKDGHDRLEHLSPAAFRLKLAAYTLMVGKKEEPISKLWMEWKGRRSFDGIVFVPEQPVAPNFYNLWKGFAVTPAPSGSTHPMVDRYLDHLLVNVCGGSRSLFSWLIHYFAHLVQKPWEKPLVALVLQGPKGVGKNMAINPIGALLGRHFLVTADRRYLVGNFNGYLENCLLFTLDEAFWSGDKQAEGVLKNLVTGKQHLIEHKGCEPYTVDNRTRIVILGNDPWLTPASHDERRFAVFTVGERNKQQNAYFREITEGMASGGASVLLRYLLDIDLDLAGVDINTAPSTTGLHDQKVHTLETCFAWWRECLKEGELLDTGAPGKDWPAEIERATIQSAIRRYTQSRQIRSRLPSSEEIGRQLRRCCPGIGTTRPRREGRPVWCYSLPPLVQARKEWEQWIGHPEAWEEEGQ